MERLTNRNAEIPLPDSVHATYWALVHEKLARYEDAEQQGRLLVLPCKVGDKIYILRGDVRNGYETVKKTHVEEVPFGLGCLNKQKKATEEECNRRWDEISLRLTVEKEKNSEIAELNEWLRSFEKRGDFWYETAEKVTNERDDLQNKLSAILCPHNDHVWVDGCCVKCGRVK